MSTSSQAGSALPRESVTYQVPRNVLLPLLFRRMLFNKKRLLRFAFALVGCALICMSGQVSVAIGAGLIIFILLLFPFMIYMAVARAIRHNPYLVEQKTLTFTPEGITVTGANYHSEMAWSMFHGFTEDSSFFYLLLGDSGFDSAIPKSAFTSDQQNKFRQDGTLGTGKNTAHP